MGSSQNGCSRTSRPRSGYCSATATATATATCQRASPSVGRLQAGTKPSPPGPARPPGPPSRGAALARAALAAGAALAGGVRMAGGISTAGGVGPVFELVQAVVQSPDALEDQRVIGIALAVM